MTSKSHWGDAGFGLVEMLVALAICSLIVVGIGGLFAFAGQIRDRSEGTTAIQRTLLEVIAVSSGLGELAGTRLTGASPRGFQIERSSQEEAGNPRPYATVTLTPGRLGIQYSGSSSTISVDLSSFETVRLEYLAISDQSADWQLNWENSASPRAVRLLATNATWRWPLLLWVADRGERL